MRKIEGDMRNNFTAPLVALFLLASAVSTAAGRAKNPREHHLHFAHRQMPREFFGNPAKMMETLQQGMGDTFLFYVWQELGKTLKHPLKHADIGSLPGSKKKEVLTLSIVGIDKKDGWTWAVIRLPPTVGPGESVYIIMLQRPGQARYFTVDRTKQAKRGALVERFKDGRSRLRSRTGYAVDEVLASISAVLSGGK